MKFKKIYLLLLFLFCFIPTSYSQSRIPKMKKGETYFYDYKTKEWIKIRKELFSIEKEGKDSIIALQYKLQNAGYDVAISGHIDLKTIKAFNDNLKRLKKLKRKARKKKINKT